MLFSLYYVWWFACSCSYSLFILFLLTLSWALVRCDSQEVSNASLWPRMCIMSSAPTSQGLTYDSQLSLSTVYISLKNLFFCEDYIVLYYPYYNMATPYEEK